MDEALIEALAAGAGLQRAWAMFRDDVIAAANRVERQRWALTDPALIADGSNAPWREEPWPPMRVPG